MANKHIEKHINKLLETKTKLLELDLGENDKYVFFSDLHRGLGDVADDFKAENQKSYFTALGHYFNDDFTLVLLGDVEELEEQQNIGRVMRSQTQAILNEKRFHDAGRFIKIFGNHDDKWEKDKNVNKHLDDHFPGLTVYEGILFNRHDNSKILAVHGHQGAVGSDILPFLEFFLPVYRWGLNILGKNRHNEFKDVCLVGERENHLYDWVEKKQNTILICGHTHRPVWGGQTHAEKLQVRIEDIKEELQPIADSNGITIQDTISRAEEFGLVNQVSELRDTISDLQVKIAQNGMCSVHSKPKPLFYNTGCCMFSDGDITGIEIEGDQLRLIKWSYNDGRPIKDVLEEGMLSEIFELV